MGYLLFDVEVLKVINRLMIVRSSSQGTNMCDMVTVFGLTEMLGVFNMIASYR